MKLIFSVTLLVITSQLSYATPINWDPGFHGDLAVIAGYQHTESQFDTDRKVISSLDTPPSRNGGLLIAPLGTLSYTFSDEKKQLFFGTDRADIALGRFHAQLGYRYRFTARSVLAFSYIPGVLPQQTWQDPYQLSTPRKTSDSYLRALRIQYSNIANSAFSLDSAYGKYQIDHERSGESQGLNVATLDRNDDRLWLELSYMMPLNHRQFLRPAFSYTHINAKSDAMSSSIYSTSLSMIRRFDNMSTTVTLSYKQADFNGVHPLFLQQRKDDHFGVFIAYQYNQPLGWKHWAIVSLMGYNQTQSNIAFYDQKSWLIGTGLNYRF